MSITQAMLQAALPDGTPPRIQALVQPAVADGLLADFKVGPIIPFGRSGRPVRVAVSDQGETAQWTEAVRLGWPGPPRRTKCTASDSAPCILPYKMHSQR